jgi:hypothetical protein
MESVDSHSRSLPLMPPRVCSNATIVTSGSPADPTLVNRAPGTCRSGGDSEYLRQLLWPDGEFIDHDHAINRAVNFLRTVLRDNPKKPQFIETLPKRGYRFIGDVSCFPSKVQPSAELAPRAAQSDAGQVAESEMRWPEAIELAQGPFGDG